MLFDEQRHNGDFLRDSSEFYKYYKQKLNHPVVQKRLQDLRMTYTLAK